MSITVRDCLKLPSLSGGIVEAGEKGLDEIVTVVSVLEYDDGYKVQEKDSRKSFSTYNELLITSFHSIKDDVEAQCKSIRYFKRTGNVAIVFLDVGYTLNEIDPRVIQAANEEDMPIIALYVRSNKIRYSDIISEVMELVFTDQKREKNFVQTTMKIFSRFPKSMCTIENLMRIIGDSSKVSLFLCDENRKLIANALWPLHSDLEFPNMLEVLEGNKFREKTVIYDEGIKIEYYYFNIVCSEIKFSLMVIDQYNNFNSTTLSEIEECISLFITIYHYNIDNTSTEALIPALLSNDEYWCGEISSNTGYYIEDILNTYIIRSDSLERESANKDISNKEVFNPLVKDILKLEKNFHMKIIVGVYDKSCFILQFDFGNSTQEEIEESYISVISGKDSKKDWNSKVSMGNSIIGSNKAMDYRMTCIVNKRCGSIPKIYENLKEYEGLLRKIFPNKHKFLSSDIAFASRINDINESESDRKRFLDITEPIVLEAKDNLLVTLTTYLFEANSESKATSEILFVHRNTIQYRLAKIKRLLGCDLNQSPQTYEIYLSCALRRSI